jgi:hypothetical protein
MGLGCWPERLLDTNVKLSGTDPEPATTPQSQGRRLLDFLQSKQVAEETACLRLASFRSGDLQVIDVCDQHATNYLKVTHYL